MENPRFFRVEKQTVALQPLDGTGLILDLGGGGEAVIGQLCGTRVIAIDKWPGELQEAPDGPLLKIVMDATKLQFLDATFEDVTAFFFLMFLPPEDRESVFREVYRVMKPGGIWRIWDMTIPPFPGGAQDIYVFGVEVQFPDRTIETGYGALWPGHEQTLQTFTDLAAATGFQVRDCREREKNYYVELLKPAA